MGQYEKPAQPRRKKSSNSSLNHACLGVPNFDRYPGIHINAISWKKCKASMYKSSLKPHEYESMS